MPSIACNTTSRVPPDLAAIYRKATNVKTRAYLYEESLGFRTRTKASRKSSRTSFTTEELRRLYRATESERRDITARVDIDALEEEVLDPTSILHASTQKLLNQFGSSIWSRFVGDQVLDKEHYRQHLYYDDPTDQKLIYGYLLGWLTLRVFRSKQDRNGTPRGFLAICGQNQGRRDQTLRSSTTTRRSSISSLSDIDDFFPRGDANTVCQTSDVTNLDALPLAEQSSLHNVLPSTQPTYRASIAPMYPPGFPVTNGTSPSVLQPRSGPQPTCTPQLTRGTPSRKRNASAVDEDSDDSDSLYIPAVRRNKSTSVRSYDSVFDGTPPAHCAQENNQNESSNTTFSKLRDNAGHGGIRRYCSSTGQTFTNSAAAGQPVTSKGDARVEDTLTASSRRDFEPGSGVLKDLLQATMEHPCLGGEQDALRKHNTETSSPEGHAEKRIVAAGEGTCNVQITPHACTSPIVQGNDSHLVFEKKLNKKDTTSPSSEMTRATHTVHTTSSKPSQDAHPIRDSAPPQAKMPPPAPAPGGCISFRQENVNLDKKLKLDRASSLFDVLMSGSPEKHVLKELEEAIAIVEAVLISREQELVVANAHHQTALEQWLICVRALVKFRQVTGFTGDKSERTAMIKGLAKEKKYQAYHLLAGPAAKLAVDIADFSRSLAEVLFSVAEWPDGFDGDEMTDIMCTFNRRLVVWFSKDENS